MALIVGSTQIHKGRTLSASYTKYLQLTLEWQGHGSRAIFIFRKKNFQVHRVFYKTRLLCSSALSVTPHCKYILFFSTLPLNMLLICYLLFCEKLPRFSSKRDRKRTQRGNLASELCKWKPKTYAEESVPPTWCERNPLWARPAPAPPPTRGLWREWNQGIQVCDGRELRKCKMEGTRKTRCWLPKEAVSIWQTGTAITTSSTHSDCHLPTAGRH